MPLKYKGDKAKSNLENFKSQWSVSDLARTERFEVEFNFPPSLQVGGVEDKKDASWRAIIACEEVQIPGMVLQNKEHNIGAWTFYRNTNMGFLGNEINFTFLTDNDWLLRGTFERWIDLCVGTNSKEIAFPDDCHGTIAIKTLDRQDKVTAYWELYECMPRVLNLIPLGMGNTGVARTSMIVTAAYWKSLDVDVDLGAITEKITKKEEGDKGPQRAKQGREIPR